VTQTNDNGYIVCGYTTIGSNLDFYLIKTNNDGYTGFNAYEQSMLDFYLYPNPSTGIFQIQMNGYNNESIQIRVMNCSGQIILKKIIDFNQIDLTEYGNGLYLLQFIYRNGETFSRKVIVQH